ncbi:MAG: molecular chaperone DnaJ [bacterium]
MAQDFYQTLGVSKTASQDEIKKAFRKKAHEFHPDKKGGDETKFKQINEAYQTLGNPQKRAQYDQFGQAGPQGQPGGAYSWSDFSRGGGFPGGASYQSPDMGDLGDIFGDLFGFGGGRKSSGRSQQERGLDIEAELEVDFSEAAFGVEKIMELSRDLICATCHGDGAKPGSKTSECGTCKGSGQVAQVRNTIFGAMQTVGRCPNCQGEGKIITEPCVACRGEGRTATKKALKVQVPAGISSGQSIRLSGEGQAGRKKAPAGDLYLRIRVKSDPRFNRKGDDVYSDISVSVSQAALGDKISVETLDGQIKLDIPAGTQPSTKIKLKGKGMSHLHGRGRGDAYFVVKVEIPKKLSKEQKKLYEELREGE